MGKCTDLRVMKCNYISSELTHLIGHWPPRGIFFMAQNAHSHWFHIHADMTPLLTGRVLEYQSLDIYSCRSRKFTVWRVRRMSAPAAVDSYH